MMPLGKVGSPQDTLTEVVVSSLKWMKLGALGAEMYGSQRSKDKWEITRRLCNYKGFLRLYRTSLGRLTPKEYNLLQTCFQYLLLALHVFLLRLLQLHYGCGKHLHQLEGFTASHSVCLLKFSNYFPLSDVGICRFKQLLLWLFYLHSHNCQIVTATVLQLKGIG